MLHNYFTISQGKNTSTSFNSMSNIFLSYVLGEKIAKYFYIKTLSGKSIFIDSTIEDGNFDITNGYCFCKYSIILESGKLDGETITEIGFCANQSLNNVTNSAPFSFLATKERAVITGVLYLQINSTHLCFTKGENKLIKAFLGAIEFPFMGFKMGLGTNYLENVPIKRKNEQISQLQTVYPLFSDSGMLFSATFTEPVGEVLLLLDNEVVLRSKNETSFSIRLNIITAQNKGYVILSEDFITDITDVLINSDRVYNYNLIPIAESLLHLTDSDMLFNNASKIISFGDINNFAVLNNDDAVLYKHKEGKLKPYKWLNGVDEIKVCANGRIVAFNKDLSISIIDDNSTTVLPIKAGEKNEVVAMSDRYLIASHSEGSVRLCYLDSLYNITNTTNIPYIGNVRLLAMGNFIAIISFSSTRAFSPFTENTTLASFLDNNRINLLNNHTLYHKNRIIFTSIPAYIDLMETNLKSINKNGKIYCDYFVYEEGDKSVITSIENTQIPLITTASKVKQLFTQGSHVFILTEDGVMSAYLAGFKKTKLCHDNINVGSIISYNLRSLHFTEGQIGFNIQRG